MKFKIHALVFRALLYSLLALCQMTSAVAAGITWGSSNNITGYAGFEMKNFQPDNNVTQRTANGTADIQYTGTSVFALNFTGVSGEPWHNRVTFFESTPHQTIIRSAYESGALTQNGVTLTFGPGWSGNTRIGEKSPQGDSYGHVGGYTWDTLSYMRSVNATSGTLTFSGLTIGRKYAVQFWVQDARSSALTRTLTLAGSTPVTLDYNNGAGVGQWAIGTFTADNTNQTISIAANQSVQVNMLQLRALPAAITAADGIWAGGDGNWTTNSNWESNTIGQGIDKSASFNRSSPVIAVVDEIRPIGALFFSGANHTLSEGAGSLTLDGDTTYPTPNISVAGGITATVNAMLTGTEGLLKSGTGTLVLRGISIYSGTTSITEGTVVYQGGSFKSTTHSIATSAVLEFNVASTINYDGGSTTINGGGTLRKTGAGRLRWPVTSATFALDPGALIDIQQGDFTGGSDANEDWVLNASDLNVAAGAFFNTVEANVRVDKITGSGTIGTGYSGAGYQNLTIGVANGSSRFSGAITNTEENPAFVGNLVKAGAGTITLAGLNTYTGDTTINGGTLELADNARLSFVVSDGDANLVTGSGIATLCGDFVIDTSSVTGSTSGIWTLVDLTTLNPRSSFEPTFTVVGFADSDNDGIWTMNDAKGYWSFDESNGVVRLDLGKDYALTLSAYSNGNISGAGNYEFGASVTLTATPLLGYLFTGWTGDASGTTNPLTITIKSDKIVGATFAKDLSDSDNDGISAYDELVLYGTDPALADSDSDGLNDGYEVGIGRFSIVSGSFTWQQARNDAQGKGGDLASFPSEDRWNRALQGLAANPFDEYTGLWIGASDAAVDGTWTWVNSEVFSFAPWGTGRPSSTPSNTLDFAEVSGGGGAEIGKWYDRSSTTIRDGYLLEIGYATNPIVADADADGLDDGQELAARTNPKISDTDGDGWNDGAEQDFAGDPLSADVTPNFQCKLNRESSSNQFILRFPAALGKLYSIEASEDLTSWHSLEASIMGYGNTVTRAYPYSPTQPMRYFQIKRN